MPEKYRGNGFGFLLLFFALILTSTGLYFSQNSKLSESSFASTNPSLPADYYMDHIQPIFNQKCATCHSCMNSPCQFNLTSFEGFERGANKFVNPYSWVLSGESPLTRLGLDAFGEKEWRKKGFYSMHKNTHDVDKTIFMSMLQMKSNSISDDSPKIPAEESRSCPVTYEEQQKYAENFPASGMPYGLPEISNQEYETLKKWIKNGATGPSKNYLEAAKSPSPIERSQIDRWQKYLNQNSLEQKLVSRYIYEHLFLAHINFYSGGRSFYRLVRSKTSCDKPLSIISSRRPSDHPGVETFHYCFDKITELIVDKTHIPYELSDTKLNRVQSLFNDGSWKVTGSLPSYDPKLAMNPFETFKDIPAKSRYQFLLDDAQYHVNTFIKGPVCFGNVALSSISDQFFVFFIKPESDLSVTDRAYERSISPYLYLPASWGSDIDLIKQVGGFSPSLLFTDKDSLVEKMKSNQIIRQDRNTYRKLRSDALAKSKPLGYSLTDIWDGDQFNANAVLTILRHYDSSSVVKGAYGDTSKTVYMLDYPLFERLVYNLVVGYDVFSGTGHQVLSRLYMDYIRMEAEENYLLFLPADMREGLRNSWYEGRKAQAKLNNYYPQHGLNIPSAIKYRDSKRAQSEFVEKVLFERFKSQVRGPIDWINWENIYVPKTIRDQQKSLVDPLTAQVNSQLSQLTSKPGSALAISKYSPDVMFIRIGMGKPDEMQDMAFSVIKHMDYTNLAFMFKESKRRNPEKDSLSIFPGFVGSYPNYFLYVNFDKLDSFVQDAKAIKNKDDFRSFQKKWGVSRKDPAIWDHFDWFNRKSILLKPLDSGVFDLTRYEIFN